MVGVAKSTLPTRTVGEVLTQPGRKSMPGSSFVRPEYFANPSVQLAKYSPLAWSGEWSPTTRPSQSQDLPPILKPGRAGKSLRAGGA
jgi:hypothetical protein